MRTLGGLVVIDHVLPNLVDAESRKGKFQLNWEFTRHRFDRRHHAGGKSEPVARCADARPMPSAVP